MRNQNRHHILVVDDEDLIRDILREGLEQAGYGCSTAADGLEALEILAQRPVDVVITDISMPRLDGIALAERIRRNHTADVIVMTGFAENLSYEDIIAQGASDFIQKPVGVREIIVRLERVIRERTISSEQRRTEKELRSSLEKLRRVLTQTVNALASSLEKRDPYTAGHQQRVARLAHAVARQMGLSEEQAEGIRIAGILHDIGKISVPTDILTKPGRLSVNEFNLIKARLQTTDGNLSVHLRKLEDAGYVSVDKRFVGRKPLTRIRMTAQPAYLPQHIGNLFKAPGSQGDPPDTQCIHLGADRRVGQIAHQHNSRLQINQSLKRGTPEAARHRHIGYSRRIIGGRIPAYQQITGSYRIYRLGKIRRQRHNSGIA